MAKQAEEYNKIRQEMVKSYFNSLNQLEKYKYIELNSALIIQKNARRLICRKRFKLLKDQALEIQKSFRGYLARANHQKDVEEQNDNLMKQFFEYHISIIIKHWRGYQHRKAVMDYHANKKWLEMTKLKNEETLNKVQEYSQKMQYDLERKREEEQRKAFNKIAANLHHLVSTNHIPGVFNPPRMLEEAKPQVYNADIETHLKLIFKNSFRKTNANANVKEY